MNGVGSRAPKSTPGRIPSSPSIRIQTGECDVWVAYYTASIIHNKGIAGQGGRMEFKTNKCDVLPHNFVFPQIRFHSREKTAGGEGPQQPAPTRDRVGAGEEMAEDAEEVADGAQCRGAQPMAG